MVDNVTYLHGLGKSDHICTVFDMVCYTEKQYKSLKIFIFKKLIGSSFGTLGCQPSLEKITGIFTNFVNSTIPLQTIHPTKVNPYINSKVLKFKRNKLYYWREYCNSASHFDYSKFAHTCNALCSLTQSLRSNYEKNLMKNSKTNPQMF